MAGLPAVCDNGHRYEDHNISIGDGVVAATFIGNRVGPCPKCGGMASIIDGTYDVVGGVAVRRAVASAASALTHPDVSVADLLSLRRILSETQAGSSSRDDLRERLEADAPSAAGIVDWMKSPDGLATATWLDVFIPALLAIIGIVIALKALNQPNPPAVPPHQIEQITEQIVEQLRQASTTTTAITNSTSMQRQRGGEACACGSKRQFKNCHGRRSG